MRIVMKGVDGEWWSVGFWCIKRLEREGGSELLTGQSEKAVARTLYLSIHRVHNHVQAIFRLLDVHSKPECCLADTSPPRRGRTRGGSINSPAVIVSCGQLWLQYRTVGLLRSASNFLTLASKKAIVQKRGSVMEQTLCELDVPERVSKLNWMHTIDLGHGVVTQGKWGQPSSIIKKALDDTDLRGKKVLDIGCWDGLWSFEAERRGAREVYATDLISQRSFANPPTSKTFLLGRQILGSRVQYDPDLSVYEVGRLGVSDFDIVLFLGVHYHLKDPLLALARLRQVMRPGAILVVEGEVLDDDRASYARFCYHNHHGGDQSNWWVPTIACLREWVECNFFEIVDEYQIGRTHATPTHRLKTMVKRALGRPEKVDTIRYVVRGRG